MKFDYVSSDFNLSILDARVSLVSMTGVYNDKNMSCDLTYIDSSLGVSHYRGKCEDSEIIEVFQNEYGVKGHLVDKAKRSFTSFDSMKKQRVNKLKLLNNETEFPETVENIGFVLDDSVGDKLGRNQIGYIFTILFVTTREYTEYHGGSKESVLLSLYVLLARINLIFSRDIGVLFKLSPRTFDTICTQEDPDCDDLPNDISLINSMSSFLSRKNISFDEYDLAHGLSTSGGGRASYPSLCRRNRMRGVSGISKPEGDTFHVNFVAHEIAHQLFAAHSFQDCIDSNNFMLAGAVEPGSGSTIMSYAGLCEKNNVKESPDSYFNLNNIHNMRRYVSQIDDCGEKIDLEREKIGIPDFETCALPYETTFYLIGKVNKSGEFMFSWESSERGNFDFDDQQRGRFFSFPPINSPMRYFPRILISYNQDKDALVAKETKEESFPFQNFNQTNKFMFGVFDSYQSAFNLQQPSVAEVSVVFKPNLPKVEITKLVQSKNQITAGLYLKNYIILDDPLRIFISGVGQNLAKALDRKDNVTLNIAKLRKQNQEMEDIDWIEVYQAEVDFMGSLFFDVDLNSFSLSHGDVVAFSLNSYQQENCGAVDIVFPFVLANEAPGDIVYLNNTVSNVGIGVLGQLIETISAPLVALIVLGLFVTGLFHLRKVRRVDVEDVVEMEEFLRENEVYHATQSRQLNIT